MNILKRKTLAALLALSLLASLLPIGAQPALAVDGSTVYVGGVKLTGSTDNPVYATTDDSGNVSAEGASAESHNIKWDGQTLTLKDAYVTGQVNSGNIAGAAIGVENSNGAELTIQLEDSNTVSASVGIYVHSSGGNASLTITGNGSLTTEGSGSGSLSGISVQSNDGNANLTINNVDVTATNSYAQGIRLQPSESASATLAVNGGSLTASGSKGIDYQFGTGATGSGTPSLTVSGNAIVRANGGIANNSSSPIQYKTGSGSTGGIVFDGGEGTVYGSVTLQENLTIGKGESLTVPEESSLTIPDGKTLTVNGGELTGNVPQSGVTYKVTKVELSTSTLALTEGGSETLTAIITPSNATNQNVAWSSDNTAVATVDNSGKVTAVSAGTADITVKTQDGEKIATCTVTVTAKTYSLSVDPATLDFGSITEGDALPAAQTVTVKNTGNQTVTLVQPTATNFEIGKLSETTLAPNATATFTIQPKDNLSRGSYSEQITITDSNNVMLKLTASFTVKEPPYTGKYSYELSTSVGDHGSLTVDRYATEGEKVTITVTPDEAYKLDDLSVTAGGKEVTLTAGGDGTYTFTMPSADVKITATFAEDPDWTEPEEPATDVSDIFLDVAPNAWYKDAVQYAYAGGLMTGVSANEFAPEATTTRAMIVSMLARLEGVESAESAGFNDVAANDWYATAVNWAAASGITSGTGDGNFSPNTAITREQMAAILMNYAQYKGQDVSARATLDTYNDATAISSWANDVMSWAVAEGLLTGVTNDQLQPQGNATRAQVAAILQRFLDN